MPFANLSNARLYYRLEGREDRPVLVLSHSLGADHGLWNPQVPQLLDYFRVLRYDTRGHGASDSPRGDYSIEQLSRDALELVDAFGIDRFALCGLSLGGMTGQWIAAYSPERLTKLVLANTSAKFPDPTLMESRRQTVLSGGMAAIAGSSIPRSFSTGFLAANHPHVASILAVLLATNPIGYAGCCAAVRDLDNRALLDRIQTPTLIIAGDNDVSTPWIGHGEHLATAIRGAKAVRLPAAHLSNLERPRTFTWALLDFLVDQPSDAGMSRRRSILGDAYVDRAIANTSELNRDFQELITRYAWGTIWTRPGLEAHTRRLLVLATTSALGRWEEFRLHLRAGLDQDLEICDIKEVLMQAAIYAGVPCANTGFHIVAEELARREQHSEGTHA